MVSSFVLVWISKLSLCDKLSNLLWQENCVCAAVLIDLFNGDNPAEFRR